MAATNLPRAVLFDWDNTLIDSWPVIFDALAYTFTRMGHQPWTMAETRRRVRTSLQHAFPPLFGDDWRRAGDIYLERFAAIHLGRLTALAGAGEMLLALRDMGIYLGVVSNKTGHFLRVEAARLGWSEYFGKLIGASDADRDKPAADAIHAALAGSGVEAGPQVWFAGDMDIDLECAKNARCLPVLLRPEKPAEGEFDGHPLACYFSSCGELRAHLEGLAA